MDQTFLVVIIAAIAALTIVIAVVASRLRDQRKASRMNEQFDETRKEVRKTLFRFWLEDRLAEWMRTKPQPLLPRGKEAKLLGTGSNPLSVIPKGSPATEDRMLMLEGRERLALPPHIPETTEEKRAASSEIPPSRPAAPRSEAPQGETDPAASEGAGAPAEPPPSGGGASGAPPPPSGSGIASRPPNRRRAWKKRYIGGGIGLISLLLIFRSFLWHQISRSFETARENLGVMIALIIFAAAMSGLVWYLKKDRRNDPDQPRHPQAKKARFVTIAAIVIVALSSLLMALLTIAAKTVSSIEWVERNVGAGTVFGVIALIVVAIIVAKIPWKKIRGGDAADKADKTDKKAAAPSKQPSDIIGAIAAVIMAIGVFYVAISIGVWFTSDQEARRRAAEAGAGRRAMENVRYGELVVGPDAWVKLELPRPGIDWSVDPVEGDVTVVLTQIDIGSPGWYFFPGLTEPPFDMSQFEPSHQNYRVVTDGLADRVGVYTKATEVVNNVPKGKLVGAIRKRWFQNAKEGTVTVRYTVKQPGGSS